MFLFNRAREVAEEKSPMSNHKLFAAILRPLSLLYCLVVLLRVFLYKSGFFKKKSLSVPVISVGNVTAGGTGKTPVVAMMVELLKRKGKRPVILSRGYKGTASSKVNVISDHEKVRLPSTLAGDEPFLLANKLPGVPVLTGTDRYVTGQYAISKLGAEVLILDDGFQHIRLKRDLDVLLVDSTNPFGNGFILPRGTLREPVDAMDRADVIVLTKCDKDKETIFPFETSKPVCAASIVVSEIVELNSKKIYDLKTLHLKKVFAFSGIGAPDSFHCTLSGAGCDISGFQIFPDHYNYTIADSQTIGKEALKKGADLLITTEKDAVRLSDDHLFPLPVFYLIIKIQMIIGQETLESKINALFH